MVSMLGRWPESQRTHTSPTGTGVAPARPWSGANEYRSLGPGKSEEVSALAPVAALAQELKVPGGTCAAQLERNQVIELQPLVLDPHVTHLPWSRCQTKILTSGEMLGRPSGCMPTCCWSALARASRMRLLFCASLRSAMTSS